jgi:hypothetical protein
VSHPTELEEVAQDLINLGLDEDEDLWEAQLHAEESCLVPASEMVLSQHPELWRAPKSIGLDTPGNVRPPHLDTEPLDLFPDAAPGWYQDYDLKLTFVVSGPLQTFLAKGYLRGRLAEGKPMRTREQGTRYARMKYGHVFEILRPKRRWACRVPIPGTWPHRFQRKQ